MKFGSIVDEPLHATLEARQLIHDFGLQCLYCKEWNQADHGAYFEWMVVAVG
jgi:hypothetical protein